MKLGDNLPDYDAIGRRNVEPDFSFAQKVVQPKLFNGKGEVVGEKRERRKTIENTHSKRRGESLEFQPKRNSASNPKNNKLFRLQAFSALKSIQKVLTKKNPSDDKIQEISKIVEGFDEYVKDLEESCQM